MTRARREMVTDCLLILGASARAAVASAIQAGIPVQAADLFGDADLREMLGDQFLGRLPSLRQAWKIHQRAQDGPWMYTGGMENRPQLVDKISTQRPLLGCTAETLRRVRNPRNLGQVLRSRGFDVPEICRQGRVPAEGRWLIKRKRSGGGLRIRFGQPGKPLVDGRRFFLQEFIPGSSWSGVYLAGGRSTQLLAVTQQWHCRGFRYLGSLLGPHVVAGESSSAWRSRWAELGHVVASEFKLRGLFGIDAIVRDVSAKVPPIVPLEVNPRYTASMELVELAQRDAGYPLSLVEQHVQSCRDPGHGSPSWCDPRHWWGKIIYYAQRDVIIGERFHDVVRSLNHDRDLPRICDIPILGSKVTSGTPVVTILAKAASRTDLEMLLGISAPSPLLKALETALSAPVA